MASFTGGEIKTKSFEKAAVSPELASCRFRGVLYVSWKTNGCKFLFHAGGGVGTIDITSCEKPMTMESSGCRIEIDNQRGLGPVTYANSAKLETINASAVLKGITYTRNGCSSWADGTFSDGTYTGAWTIKGSTTSGISASTWDESAAVPPISAFAFEQAPATVKSGNVALGALNENGGNAVSCNKFSVSGSSSSALTGTLSLVPSFKECTMGTTGGPKAIPDSNISAGSCSYVLHGNGGFDIGGEGCASNPMSFTNSLGCVVTVGPQSYAGGLTFKSEGVGKLQTLSIPSVTGEASVFKGVTYTATGVHRHGRELWQTGHILHRQTGTGSETHGNHVAWSCAGHLARIGSPGPEIIGPSKRGSTDWAGPRVIVAPPFGRVIECFMRVRFEALRPSPATSVRESSVKTSLFIIRRERFGI